MESFVCARNRQTWLFKSLKIYVNYIHLEQVQTFSSSQFDLGMCFWNYPLSNVFLVVCMFCCFFVFFKLTCLALWLWNMCAWWKRSYCGKLQREKMLQKHYARQAAKNENAFGKLNGEANSYRGMGITAVWCPVGHRCSMNTLGDLD